MSSRASTSWRDWFTFSRPINRFSLEELERLHNELIKQTKIHKIKKNHRSEFLSQRSTPEGNKATFIETLRSIAELMIWGDQHEPRFFEFFLEKNILFEFYDILASSMNRQGQIATQVLQTLSIMISNMKKETSVFYLFSNNHINNILQLDFDFSDEEVLAFYISFLKSISLKLNPKTIHFFFQRSEDGTGASFPLYTEAIRFVGNKEAMVRAAVRTLTLNIYRVDDEDVQAFVVSKPASNYFTELALYAAEQCQLLDRSLLEAENKLDDSFGSLDSQLDRIEDAISYFNDIFVTGSEVLCSRLASCLWEYFISPALFWPLLEVGSRSNSETSLNKPFISANGVTGGGVFRAATSLCVIERIIHLMESPILTEAIACCLLAGENCETEICEKATNRQFALRPTTPSHAPNPGFRRGGPSTSLSTTASPVAGISGSTVDSTKDLFVKYRFSFLRCLSGDSTQIGTAAVRVLVALISQPGIDPKVLDICGVLPARIKIRQNLINELTGPDESDDSTPIAASSNLSPQRDDEPDSRPRASRPIRFLKGLTSRNNRREMQEQTAEMSEEEETREESDELLEALCRLTLLPTLPPQTVCHITHIIAQLTLPSEETRITDGCGEFVKTALMVCRTSVGDEMRSVWSDVLVPLLHQQWSQIRTESTEPSLDLSSTSLLHPVFAQVASELGSPMYNNQGSVSSQQLAVRLRLSCSAQYALHILSKVDRLIALTQLQQCLTHGSIEERCQLPWVTAESLYENEIREKSELDLDGLSTIPCAVSFSSGQEQTVYYCLHGAVSMNGSYERQESEILHKMASAVLVAPSPTRINTGTVMSVAPILGSEPQLDPRRSNWLHVRVRPSVLRFLTVVEKCKHSCQPPWVSFREMHDGHWVLAFETHGQALSAKYMTQECVAKTAVLYCDVLSVFLSPETIHCEQKDSD